MKIEKMLLFVVMMSVCGLFSCAKKVSAPTEAVMEESEADEDVAARSGFRAGLLKGLSALPACYLMEEGVELEGEAVSFETFSSSAALLSSLLRGSVEAAFLPVEACARVAEKNPGLLVCGGVSAYETSFLVSSDEDYEALESLAGKRVFLCPGTVGELLFKKALLDKGLKVIESEKESAGAVAGFDGGAAGEDVTGQAGGGASMPADGDSMPADGAVILDYSLPLSEIASFLVNGKASYAVLNEPFATVAQERSRGRVRRLEAVHESASFGESALYARTALVFHGSFAKENGEKVKAFCEAYEKAVEKTLSKPLEAVALASKAGLYASSFGIKAVAREKYVWLWAKDGKMDIERTLKLYGYGSGAEGEAALPSDDFYWNGE